MTSSTADRFTTISPETALHQGWLAASKGAAPVGYLAAALQTGKLLLALALHVLWHG